MDKKSKASQMRQPFPVRSLHGSSGGHFYINRKSIDVYAPCGRITKQQLEAALRLMGKV
jgi:hypothetical protein